MTTMQAGPPRPRYQTFPSTCAFHAPTAGGWRPLIGTPADARLLLEHATMSPALRAAWASDLSMGDHGNPACCPAAAYARELMAAAFRAVGTGLAAEVSA